MYAHFLLQSLRLNGHGLFFFLKIFKNLNLGFWFSKSYDSPSKRPKNEQRGKGIRMKKMEEN